MREAVVSCPKCCRQYAVDSEMDAKLGQCRACKSTFQIVFAKAEVGDFAISLDDPLTLHFNFHRDGCREMISYTTQLLKMADKPISIDAVCLVATSLPRKSPDLMSDEWRAGYCSRMLEIAHGKIRGTGREASWHNVFDYFAVYIPSRSPEAIDMLVGSFDGVLGGLFLDEERLRVRIMLIVLKPFRRVIAWFTRRVAQHERLEPRAENRISNAVHVAENTVIESSKEKK